MKWTLLTISLATLGLLYFRSILKKIKDDDKNTEVITWKLGSIVDHHRYNNCTLSSCWDLQRCIINYQKITVYIQPLVQIFNESGHLVTPRPSSEFLSLRSALRSQSVSDERIACIVLPGIDFLNLYRFPSEIVVESIIKLLESRFRNIFIFTFLGQQRHLSRHVIASSFGHRLLYRPYFDISIPLYNPANIPHTTSKKQFILFVPLINITSTLQRNVENAVKTIKGCLILKECPNNISVTCDENGRQISFSSALKLSTFVLILDRFPYFQSILFRAVEAAVIPILLTPDYILPWSDFIDWSRISLQPSNLSHLQEVISNVKDHSISKMRNSLKSVFRYFSSPENIALTTLRILESRILPSKTLIFLHTEHSDDSLPLMSPSFRFSTIIYANSSLLDVRSMLDILHLSNQVDEAVIILMENSLETPETWDYPFPVKTFYGIRQKGDIRSLLHRLHSNIILHVPTDSCAIKANDIRKAINIWRSNSNKILLLPFGSSGFCQPSRIVHRSTVLLGLETLPPVTTDPFIEGLLRVPQLHLVRLNGTVATGSSLDRVVI